MKPQKPYPEFPLFAHARGKWAKKINGETRYFGRWEDPTGALQEYEEWLQSRPTVSIPEPVVGLTLKLGFNKYLTQRSKDVEAGTLSQRSFTDYKRTVDAIMGHVDDSIPGLYRQLLRENRLNKATQTVHDWLYSPS